MVFPLVSIYQLRCHLLTLVNLLFLALNRLCSFISNSFSDKVSKWLLSNVNLSTWLQLYALTSSFEQESSFNCSKGGEEFKMGGQQLFKNISQCLLCSYFSLSITRGDGFQQVHDAFGEILISNPIELTSRSAQIGQWNKKR